MATTFEMVRGMAGKVNSDVMFKLSRGKTVQADVPSFVYSKLRSPILLHLKMDQNEKKVLISFLAHGGHPTVFDAYIDLVKQIGAERSIELLRLIRERLELIQQAMRNQLTDNRKAVHARAILRAAGSAENVQRYGSIAPQVVGEWVHHLNSWQAALLDRQSAVIFIKRARERTGQKHAELAKFLVELHKPKQPTQP